MVKVQGYGFNVVYKPVLPDTLSRLPDPKKSYTIHFDLNVQDVYLDQLEDGHQVDLIHFGNVKQDTLCKRLLRKLQQTIKSGWSDTIKEIPADFLPYW